MPDQTTARPGVALWTALAGLAVLRVIAPKRSDTRSDKRSERPARGPNGAEGARSHGGTEARHVAAREGDRGRHADTPAAIPAAGWKDIGLRVFQEFNKDRVLAVAAGVTFYGLLALFPAIGALVSLYGLVADASSINDHLASLQGVIPGGAIDVVGEQVKRIASKGGGTLGFTFFTGLAISLWSANAGMKALFDALNIVYEEEEKRSFVMLNLQSLAFTLGALLFVIAAITGIVVLPVMFNFLGLGDGAWLLALLRWPALFAVLLGGLALLYRFGPSRDRARWRWVTAGSGLAGLLWMAGSILFSWYVSSFGNYNETYGSLGAVIGFMTWLWISTTIVLVGGEVNAEIEHQTARDTTVGRSQPLGTRRARMADTVGAAAE